MTTRYPLVSDDDQPPSCAEMGALFEAHGLTIQEWDKVRTDGVTIAESAPRPRALHVAA